MSDSVLSHHQAFDTLPTACIRFAILSHLACLIRTLLRFSAQPERRSARQLHRRQPGRSQDLLSPLKQFQRRVAVVGSVADLVAKDRFDPGGLLATSRGGDRNKVHTRDGEEAVSLVPCWRQQRQDGAAVGLATDGPIGSRRLVVYHAPREVALDWSQPPLGIRLASPATSSSPSSPSQKPRSAAPLPPRWRTDDAVRESAVPFEQHRCHTETLSPVGRRLMEGAATAATIGDARAEATPRSGRPLGNCAYNDLAAKLGRPVSRLPTTEVDQLS
jgi:hypothetical protein